MRRKHAGWGPIVALPGAFFSRSESNWRWTPASVIILFLILLTSSILCQRLAESSWTPASVIIISNPVDLQHPVSEVGRVQLSMRNCKMRQTQGYIYITCPSISFSVTIIIKDYIYPSAIKAYSYRYCRGGSRGGGGCGVATPLKHSATNAESRKGAAHASYARASALRKICVVRISTRTRTI